MACFGHTGICGSHYPIFFSGIWSVHPTSSPASKSHSTPLWGSYFILCPEIQKLQVKNAKHPTTLAFLQRCRGQSTIPPFSRTLCTHSLTSALLWVTGGDQFSLCLDTSILTSSYCINAYPAPLHCSLIRSTYKMLHMNSLMEHAHTNSFYCLWSALHWMFIARFEQYDCWSHLTSVPNHSYWELHFSHFNSPFLCSIKCQIITAI
jgi:hypothetical protein